MDGVYDWANRSGPQVVLETTFLPGELKTWEMSHGFYEMQDYPLTLGTHSVVAGAGFTLLSSPVDFQVVPEPATVLFLSIGILLIGKGKTVKELKFLFVLVVMSGFTGIGNASITDVEISPETLTINDSLRILVSGVENFSINISDSLLTIDETSIELDIYLQEGMLPVVTQWSHIENIGVLPVGTYNLIVDTWIDRSPAFNDTFTTSFAVVPEPTTILLVGTGLLCLRKKNSLTNTTARYMLKRMSLYAR